MATPPLVPPSVAAARARAAIGFAGLEHGELADATGLSIPMVRRITSKTTPRDATIERLWAIADACDVPRWFMEHGYDVPADVVERSREDVETRVASLEGTVDQISGAIAGLSDQLLGLLERQEVPPPLERPEADLGSEEGRDDQGQR